MFKKLTAASVGVVLASVAMSTEALGAGQGARVATGKTAQHRTISVKVTPNAIRLVGFSIELHCSGGYTLVDQESNFLPSALSRTGRVHDAQVGTTDEILIRGHLTGRTFGGRIRVRDRLGKHRCSSPWVRFSVKEGR
jgi:hypothetical protein